MPKPSSLMWGPGLLLVLMFCASARAQVFDLQSDREPVTSLDGEWRFHPGDSPPGPGRSPLHPGEGESSPLWASPHFDETGWASIRSDRSWNQQGYPHLSGVAWYRFRVVAAPGAASFVLLLPVIAANYQLFADGQLVGQVGKQPPGAWPVVEAARIFTIPVRQNTREVTVALRVWWPYATASLGGGPEAAACAGDARSIRAFFEQSKLTARLKRMEDYVVSALNMLVGLASLLLFLFYRNEKGYLWFGLNGVLLPGSTLLPLFAHNAWPLSLYNFCFVTLSSAGNFTFFLFVLSFAKESSRKLVLFFLCGSLLYWFGGMVDYVPPGSPRIAEILFWSADALQLAGVIVVLRRAWISGVSGTRALFWLTLLVFGWGLTVETSYLLSSFGLPAGAVANMLYAQVASEPFPITVNTVVQLCTEAWLGAILIYRFALVSRQEERMATSLDAARQLQKRLIPERLPAPAGMLAQAVYLSAEEVGGDFYQALELADGSLLLVIGDVSGKGLHAAMLGILTVGAAGALARAGWAPAQLLTRLNAQLCPATEGGFVTCLCAQLSSEGWLTLANAGHLPPYLNGEEVFCLGDLPLGAAAETEYTERRLLLPERARLTFVSDGVVEARKAGQLFGFDRTRECSRLPAYEIAAAASRFGQEDDITVITLDWEQPVQVPTSL